MLHHKLTECIPYRWNLVIIASVAIPVTPSPFCQLGMNMIGPLPETPRGNKYIVTLTDYFSKWAEAAPLPSKHAEAVARFIYSVSIHMSLEVNRQLCE